MKPLWEVTRDLHHVCEQHPVGSALASGKPPLQWYADWLGCLHQIHSMIDNDAPRVIHRAKQVQADVDLMEVKPNQNGACTTYCEQLKKDLKHRQGAIYVLTGAHLMGGEIMCRRLEGYPTNHLEWDDRQTALVELKKYREQDSLGDAARVCFQALLNMMDEIQTK